MIDDRLLQSSKLVGCDTFVAFPPASPPGMIIFGKNSDRPRGEGQSLRTYPRNDTGTAQCQCTYIQIPQVATTNAILVSQIDWMWGAEMGANEFGVVIGNEAVWTREPCNGHEKSLLGMDLVRLGLERGNTAEQALTTITSLLETYGQSGPCAENDPTFTYHNSYLIVDPKEAWVLETAGRHWVAERLTSGVRNISNCVSLRTNYDRSSKGIEEHAIQQGYWKTTTKPGQRLDFAKAFCNGSVEEEILDPRYCGGRKLLEQHSDKGTLDKDAMIAILRNHSNGICMHGGFETTASWVSEISVDFYNDNSNNGSSKRVAARHWLTGKAHPCESSFEEHTIL